MALNFYRYTGLATILGGVLMLVLSILYAFPLSQHPPTPRTFMVLLLLLLPAGILAGYAQAAARIANGEQIDRLRKAAGFVGTLTGFVLVLIAGFGNRFSLSIAGQQNLTLASLGALVSLGSVFLFGVFAPRILSWRQLPHLGESLSS